MTATLAGPFRANSTAAPLVLLAVALLAGRQAMPAQPLTPPADAQAKVDQVFSRFQKPGSPGCAVESASATLRFLPPPMAPLISSTAWL